jgi:hypothetical protein
MPGVVFAKNLNGNQSGTLRLAMEGAKAAKTILSLPVSLKADALRRISERLAENASAIFQANSRDVQEAKAEGLSSPILKRLVYDEAKLNESRTILRFGKLPELTGKYSSQEVGQGCSSQVSANRADASFSKAGRRAVQMRIGAKRERDHFKGGTGGGRTNRVLSTTSLWRRGSGLPPVWWGP